MREVHLITVGKLKDSNYEAIENDYLKRISGFKLKIHEVKAYSEDLVREGAEVMKKVNDLCKGNAQIITLSESGFNFDSNEFSSWFYGLMEDSGKPVVFVIGGASGHGQEVLAARTHNLSLGKLTYPHKMARVILVEQLYRAETIKKGHPYSK